MDEPGARVETEPEDFRTLLSERAFRVIPGERYNEVRDELHEETRVFHEAPVPEGATWPEFRDRYYPTFTRWMKVKGVDPRWPAGATVALFVGERCLLLEAPRMIELLCQLDHLEEPSLEALVRLWVAGSPGPLGLPESTTT